MSVKKFKKNQLFFLKIGFFFLTLLLPVFALFGQGSISGNVIEDTSYLGIEGIKILLLGSSHPQVATTNSKGFYHFSNLPPGEYVVEIDSLVDYVILDSKSLKIKIENANAEAHFSLSFPGNITGQVVDKKMRSPISNARVEVLREKQVLASVLTDEKGFYKIEAIATSRPCIVRVKTTDFQSCLRLVELIPYQTVNCPFFLKEATGRIMGQVMSLATGESICHATIDVCEQGVVIESVQSDENGVYALSQVSSGHHYEVNVSAVHYVNANQNVWLLAEEPFIANFVLEPCESLKGQVFHAFTGEPISGANIEIWQNNRLFTQTVTDVNGLFNFNGVGHFRVIAKASQFHSLEKNIDLPSSDPATLDFSLVCFEPSPPIKGSAKVIYKSYAHQVNRIHDLRWKPSIDPSIISYRIYREGKFIAEISANDRLIFQDQWRKKRDTHYRLVAVNSFGQESLPLLLKIDLSHN